MDSIIDFFVLLNSCSPWRASAYLFFCVIISYMVLNTISGIITNIIFGVKYNPDKNDSR